MVLGKTLSFPEILKLFLNQNKIACMDLGVFFRLEFFFFLFNLLCTLVQDIRVFFATVSVVDGMLLMHMFNNYINRSVLCIGLLICINHMFQAFIKKCSFSSANKVKRILTKEFVFEED